MTVIVKKLHRSDGNILDCEFGYVLNPVGSQWDLLYKMSTNYVLVDAIFLKFLPRTGVNTG